MRKPGGPRFFVVVEKSSGRSAGVCAVQAIQPRERSVEVGVMLRRSGRQRGYASEALSAVIAAAFETLPIDTVWVQYRKANGGAARLFDALGFYEADRWRPQGARPRLCVRIQQRSRWHAHSN